MRRLVLASSVASLVLVSACFRGATEVSESGRGLPVLRAEFPSSSVPAAVHTFTLEVFNPGPEDIATVVVAFARVGAPSVEGLPNPLVDPGRGPDSGSVVEVNPRASSVSEDRAVYRFEALEEGDSTTIRFLVRVPKETGAAASSVTVYDDVEPGRARGVRLQTLVER